VHVGFVTQARRGWRADDAFWLDTRHRRQPLLPATPFSADAATWEKHLEDPKAIRCRTASSAGVHDEQRYDIIEYLKVHRDLPETPPTTGRRCAGCAGTS
jgi:hypothetical protein